jgi:Transposase DDE domain group 1
VIAATRLRGGNAASARGAASLAARAIGTARECGCTGTIIVRMDSAFYNAAVIGAIRRGGARFSVTVPMNASIRAAITTIPEDAWTAVKYPRAVWDDQLDCWISDAEVAETEYTAFASKKGQAVTARLVVRRVRDLTKQAGQGELFPVWRYHAVFTDSPFELVQAEGQHRDHAVVEQVFADVTSGPLAHMPSGMFAANAAWLAIAAMAHNLLRAAGALASLPFAKSPGRDHPPRPDRRRRPHRPAWPRPPHPAPARRLAPRARMAHPPRRGLRPARRSGLTSPDPVSTSTATTATRLRPPAQEPRTSRRTGERQDARGPDSPRKLPVQESGRKRPTGIGRWIEA